MPSIGQGPKIGYDVSRVGAGLSRGPNQQKHTIGASWSDGTFPTPGATVDIDFVNNVGYVSTVGQGTAMQVLNYSRASSATYFGADGLLKGYTYSSNVNLLNAFNLENPWGSVNRYRTYYNIATAPDGTLSATSLTPILTLADSQVPYTTPQLANTTYTYSFYAKAGGTNWIRLRNNAISTTAGGAWFNLDTGTANTVQSSVTANCVSAGNGWFRCSITGTTPSTQLAITNNTIDVMASDGNGLLAFTTGKDVLVWGAQLEVGSVATTYYPPNTNIPRFDYENKIGAPAYKLNMILESENFANTTNWTSSNLSITTSNVISPDGYSYANCITSTANNGVHTLYMSASQSGGPKNFSVYAKANTSSKFRLGVTNGAYVDVDISNQTIIANNATINIQIQDSGNGWYRISGQESALNSVSTTTGLSLLNSANSTTFAGTTESMYFWGYQISRSGCYNNTLGSTPPYTFPYSYGLGLLPYYKKINTYFGAQYPIVINSTVNGLLSETSSTNSLLWCRDITGGANTNWLRYSQNFDNLTAWSVPNNLIVAPTLLTTDPLGTNTAYTMTSNGGTTQTRYFTQSLGNQPANKTYSVYAKAGTSNFIQIYNNSDLNAWANFDLANTANGSYGTSVVGTPTITDITNGWRRCSFNTLSTSAAGFGLSLIASPTDTRILANSLTNSNYIYIWGAQYENASSPSAYEVTTSKGVVWVKSNLNVALDQIGIDGIANSASSLTATSNNATCIQYTSLASGIYTTSLFLKSINNTPYCFVSMDNSSWFLVTLSNLWTRYVIINSNNLINPSISIKLINSGDSVGIDFCQLENRVHETTPIYTTTTTVTRSSDVCTINADGVYHQRIGTFYAKFNAGHSYNSSSAFGSCLNSVSAGGYIGKQADSSVPLFKQHGPGNNLYSATSINWSPYFHPTGYNNVDTVAHSYNNSYNSFAYKANTFISPIVSSAIIAPSVLLRTSAETDSYSGTAGNPPATSFWTSNNNLRTLYIGGGEGSNSMYIQRVKYFPRYMDSVILQEMVNK